MVEAGDEGGLVRGRFARWPLERDAELLEPGHRWADAGDKRLHESAVGDAASHAADGLDQVLGVLIVFRSDKAEPPGTGEEARTREEPAGACDRHARSGARGLDGGTASRDARSDDEHVGAVGVVEVDVVAHRGGPSDRLRYRRTLLCPNCRGRCGSTLRPRREVCDRGVQTGGSSAHRRGNRPVTSLVLGEIQPVASNSPPFDEFAASVSR